MKKTFIIIAAIVLIALAVFYYMNPGGSILESVGLKKPATDPLLSGVPVVKEDLSKGTPNNGFVPGTTVKQDANGIPLMEGKSGSYLKPDNLVKNVQKSLNERHGTNLKVDGIFGPKTAKALNVHGFAQVIYLDDYYEILGV